MATDNKTFDFAYFRQVRSRSLGRIAWRFKRYMDGFMEPRLHERGFTDFKLSYLRLVTNIEENGITNNELARKADVTKQMMSKVVSLLEEQGYIYTEKDMQDCRASRIFLNERGFELLHAVHDCMKEGHDHFASIIGQERLDVLIDNLKDLVDGLDDIGD
ncbi:winged helix-turn-helix transcriptional regulator [Fibrella sp. HMF5335]|uniref:Winged helix-turn-helix transcriptional regulator n=1 Tax=Fibrella rubiginis TaxID=2817060 RepID=A0A939K6D7_9BACT|nr:MarR family winged helix-turn-helix transcriptional regulator [Fibrella rubiginis]MBO0937420.1 winged helix-turn-helix transcriptional regulator [Fibrella rubiginis]